MSRADPAAVAGSASQVTREGRDGFDEVGPGAALSELAHRADQREPVQHLLAARLDEALAREVVPRRVVSLDHRAVQQPVGLDVGLRAPGLVDDAAQAVVLLALRRAGEDRGEKLPFLTSRKKSIAAPAIRRARGRLEQRGKLGEIRELLQNPAVAFGERVQRRAAPRSSK